MWVLLSALKMVILRRKIHMTSGMQLERDDNFITDAIANEALPILSAFIDYLWRVASDQPAGRIRPHIEREGIYWIGWGCSWILPWIQLGLSFLAYGRTCCFLLTEADFPQSGPISWPASQGGSQGGVCMDPDVSPTHACYHWAWIIKEALQ